MVINFNKNDPTTIDVFCAPFFKFLPRFVRNMPRSVIILPHSVLAKIAPICNKNESHSGL